MPDQQLADIEVKEASTTEAELNAKIDQELGIPPVKVEEKPDEKTPDEEPAKEKTPAEAEPKTDEEPAEEPEKKVTPPEEEPEEPVKPSEAATPSDEDLFIEVIDAEGVTHKISNIDDLPEDFSPKNNRQILEIIKATDRLDTEREKREADAETAARTEFIEQTKQDQFKSWDSEIAELGKAKRIEATNTDRINEVFGYMNQINEARQKANNPNLITSFEDALDKFEAKEVLDKAEADKKNGNELAKAKSSLIGRSSASGGDTYVYRAGSARNIDEIPVSI